MQDSINNQETVHDDNNETVICPNRLCGKEISTKFDNCPFCHTLLIKPTKTAEDIINEHKRKEEELRDAIRKQYRIDGDISEEQYGKLKEIYMKEYGKRKDAHQNEISSGQRNGSAGWIIGISAALILLFIIILSAGGSHSKTYNEVIKRNRAVVSAISNATNLFELHSLDDTRIIAPFEWDYLKDGDEKAAVSQLIHKKDALYEERCQQLAVGKYKLTNENKSGDYGQTYIVEVDKNGSVKVLKSASTSVYCKGEVICWEPFLIEIKDNARQKKYELNIYDGKWSTRSGGFSNSILDFMDEGSCIILQ